MQSIPMPLVKAVAQAIAVVEPVMPLAIESRTYRELEKSADPVPFVERIEYILSRAAFQGKFLTPDDAAEKCLKILEIPADEWRGWRSAFLINLVAAMQNR